MNISLRIVCLVLFLVLASCSTTNPKVGYVRSDSSAGTSDFLESFCCEEKNRAPSSATLCRDLFYGASAEKTAAAEVVREKPSAEESMARLDPSNPKTYTDQAISVVVPAGKFTMGEPGGKVTVIFPESYMIMATPFSQKFYLKLKKYLGQSEVNPSKFQEENNPVEQVSPYEADAIAADLTKLSHSFKANDQAFMRDLFPGHRRGRIYSLPTAAQLVRAFQLAKTEDGDTVDAMVARYATEKLAKHVKFNSSYIETKKGTVSVVGKLPLFLDGNPIYLVGNVFEITKDRWDGNSGLPGGINPIGTSGSYRVVVGGGWNSLSPYLRSDSRGFNKPEYRWDNLGFRLVMTDP